MIARLLTWLLGVEEINGGNRCPTYLYRWTLFQPKWMNGFGIYLHRFVADDWSLDLHDHPKRFISIGLKGGYIEETPVGRPGTPFTEFTKYRAPWLRTFPADHVHRIALEDGGSCWTLVIVLSHVREWGFWHEGAWIPWRSYVRGDQSHIADKMRACP